PDVEGCLSVARHRRGRARPGVRRRRAGPRPVRGARAMSRTALLLGFVFGALVAVTPACFEPVIRDLPDAGLVCAEGLSPCGDTCVDLRSDGLHCAACELACAQSEACAAASCLPRDCDGAD